MNGSSSNPLITNPMLSGIIERQLYVWSTMIASKIVVVLGLAPTDTEWIATGIVSAIAGIIGWYKGRPEFAAAVVGNLPKDQLAKPEVAAQVVSAAGAIPNPQASDGKTIVVTSPALAAVTPEAPTVVSSAQVDVVVK